MEKLDKARRGLELSTIDLWWRYFAIGGMSSALEVEAMFYFALVPTREDTDMLACALNERFSELGADHPIPYTDDIEPKQAPVRD